MLLEAAGLGFYIFMMFLVLKRIYFHNTPTPLYIIKLWLVALTTILIVAIGVSGGRWGELALKLIIVYVGFGYFLYVGGDMGYYKEKYRMPHDENQRAYAPEDDPNWPSH